MSCKAGGDGVMIPIGGAPCCLFSSLCLSGLEGLCCPYCPQASSASLGSASSDPKAPSAELLPHSFELLEIHHQSPPVHLSLITDSSPLICTINKCHYPAVEVGKG